MDIGRQNHAVENSWSMVSVANKGNTKSLSRKKKFKKKFLESRLETVPKAETRRLCVCDCVTNTHTQAVPPPFNRINGLTPSGLASSLCLKLPCVGQDGWHCFFFLNRPSSHRGDYFDWSEAKFHLPAQTACSVWCWPSWLMTTAATTAVGKSSHVLKPQHFEWGFFVRFVVPMEIFPLGNWGRFFQRQASRNRFAPPNPNSSYYTACWVFSSFP